MGGSWENAMACGLERQVAASSKGGDGKIVQFLSGSLLSPCNRRKREQEERD